MLAALLERWHEETNNFHFSIREMIVTLDDVMHLLHIPIVGKMIRHRDHTSHEYGVELMTELFGVDEDNAIQEIDKQWDGFIGIMFLKRLCEEQLSAANQFEDAPREEEERHNRRQWCVRAFLIFLVGCTILYDKRNKHIYLIWLDAKHDLNMIHEWSSGGITVTNIFHYLSKAIDASKGSLNRYLTLLEVVIYFVFMFVVYPIIIC